MVLAIEKLIILPNIAVPSIKAVCVCLVINPLSAFRIQLPINQRASNRRCLIRRLPRPKKKKSVAPFLWNIIYIVVTVFCPCRSVWFDFSIVAIFLQSAKKRGMHGNKIKLRVWTMRVWNSYHSATQSVIWFVIMQMKR